MMRTFCQWESYDYYGEKLWNIVKITMKLLWEMLMNWVVLEQGAAKDIKMTKEFDVLFKLPSSFATIKVKQNPSLWSKTLLLTYMFNQSILQLLPAFLAVRGVLLEHLQVHQVVAVKVAQSFKVDELFAEKEFEEFPLVENKIIY
jgi:hypothetical protein